MGVQILEATTNLDRNGQCTPEPQISGEKAAAKARNYLCKYVSISFGAEEPKLLQLEKLIWQVTVYFKLPYMEPFPVTFMDVDATTGEISEFSDEEIEKYIKRASAYAKVNPSSSTARG